MMYSIEDFKRQLRHYKVPETEYSFEGGLPRDCLCVEQNGDTWEVYYSDGYQKVTRGIFYSKNNAYKFLYYLVVKKYRDVKKRWWW